MTRAILVLTIAVCFARPAAALDLTPWNQLLTALVDGQGRVDYALWKLRHLPRLDAFLATLARENVNAYTVPDEKLAFWINAYNACVIRGVLRRYPIKSVMDHPEFFKEKAYTVAGTQLSLDDIENRMIRPAFKDARVHFALVCAARSCPRLINRAYTGAGLGALLDGQGREFLADPSKTRFEPAASRAQISSIFQWFAGDFVQAAGSVPRFLHRYAPPAAQPMLLSPSVRIEYLPYDWALNDKPSGGGGGGGSGAGSRSSR